MDSRSRRKTHRTRGKHWRHGFSVKLYEEGAGVNCHVCKGQIEDKLTTYTLDIGEQVFIIKGVPSHVCTQCGEVSYSHKVAKQLEKMIATMKDSVSEVSMTTFKAA